MSESFPLQQFKDVFLVTPKIKNKLQPFIARFRQPNMEWIMRALEQLYGWMMDDKVDILCKFNSIFGVKFIFDTAEVILVNLIEIYFLPKIVEIAKYDSTAQEDKRGVDYFYNQGYPKNTPDAEKYGFNYVRLASQFVQAASLIKPYKLFETELMTAVPSNYQLAYKSLLQIGCKPYAVPAYYKQGIIEAISTAFKKNLQLYKNVVDPIIDYYCDLYEPFLTEGVRLETKLDPAKLLEDGDVYFTSALIGQCEELLKSKMVKERINAVHLLNDFVRWADVEAAYRITCSEWLQQTLASIVKEQIENKGLDRGKKLFSDLQGSEAKKQEYYQQCLKALQFWSLCYPNGIKHSDKESCIKQGHDQLRMKFKLEFPSDKTLKQRKAEFDRNAELKKVRNQKLIVQFTEQDPDYQSLSSGKQISPQKVQSKQKIVSQKELPKKPASQVKQSDYINLKQQIAAAKQQFKSIFQTQQSSVKRINKIIDFSQHFQEKLEASELTDDEFDELMNLSEALLDNIDIIRDKLDKYLNKQINYQQLIEAIKPKSKVQPQSNSKIAAPVQSNGKIAEPQQSKTKIEQQQQPNVKVEQQVKPNIVEQSSIKLDQKVSESKIELPSSKPRIQQSFGNNQNYGNQKIEPVVDSRPKISQPVISAKEMGSLNEKNKPNQSQQRIQHPKAKVQEMTPIKRAQEEFEDIQKFQNSHSSLPQDSKHSIERNAGDEPSIAINDRRQKFTKKQQFSIGDGISIEPASHKVIQEPKINMNLFHNFNEHSNKKVEVPEMKLESKKDLPQIKKDLETKKQISRQSINSSKVEKPHSRSRLEQLKQVQGKDFDDMDLQREIQVIDDVRKVKNMNTAMGTYKFKPNEGRKSNERPNKQVDFTHIPKEDVLDNKSEASHHSHLSHNSRRSRVSSRNNSRIDFEQSKISQAAGEQQLDQMIVMPELDPLERSFHEDEPGNKELSFKKCLQVDDYLVGSNRKQKLFWLGNDTSNLVKPTHSRRSSAKKESQISVPSILNQHSLKYQQELLYLQEQKNRKIRELQGKIKNLQNEGVNLKQRLNEQDKELQMVKTNSQVDSRSQHNHYIEDQDQLFRNRNESSGGKKNLMKERSIVEAGGGRCLEPQGKLIDSRKYSQQLAQIQTEKQKKSQLKSKELLFKDDEIEFGCMSKRDGQNLLLTFFITPQFDLQGLTYSIKPAIHPHLDIQFENVSGVGSIRQRKQQKILIHVIPTALPYQLPDIEFIYNINGRMRSRQFTLSCSFPKFITLKTVGEQDLKAAFEKESNIRRGNEVPYSKKLIKNVAVLGQFLGGGQVLEGGQANSKGQVGFGGVGSWRGSQIYIRILVRPSQFLYVQGVGDSEPLDYYISVLTHLLKKSIELKQM